MINAELNHQINDYLITKIPAANLLGLTFSSKNDGLHEIHAPINLNKNDKNTGFAGSINTCLTLAAWSQAYKASITIPKLMPLTLDIVLKENHTKYLKPICNDFYAQCLGPTPAELISLSEKLEKKTMAGLTISSDIYCNSNSKHCLATFTGIFVFIKK